MTQNRPFAHAQMLALAAFLVVDAVTSPADAIVVLPVGEGGDQTVETVGLRRGRKRAEYQEFWQQFAWDDPVEVSWTVGHTRRGHVGIKGAPV